APKDVSGHAVDGVDRFFCAEDYRADVGGLIEANGVIDFGRPHLRVSRKNHGEEQADDCETTHRLPIITSNASANCWERGRPSPAFFLNTMRDCVRAGEGA